MNTLKTIYDKLGDKTELAKHEVELGLLDNYKSSVEKSISAYVQADNQFKEFKNNSKNIVSLFDNAGERFVESNIMYIDIEKKALDLGIQLPKETVNNHKSLTNYFKKIDEAIKVLKLIK